MCVCFRIVHQKTAHEVREPAKLDGGECHKRFSRKTPAAAGTLIEQTQKEAQILPQCAETGNGWDTQQNPPGLHQAMCQKEDCSAGTYTTNGVQNMYTELKSARPRDSPCENTKQTISQIPTNVRVD